MATRNLGSLTADLILKMGGFQQGMDKAARETDRFHKKITGTFKNIAGSFKTLAGVFGVGLGFESLRRAAADAIEYGDEINKASIKTGIAVEDFSELAYAAKQSDIEIAGLSTGLKKMQVSLSEAGSGSKAANETLAALGLTIGQIRDLAPDKQFELLADRIAGLQDPADRTRAAVELFGKAGADLLPLFEQGAAGIRAAREEAQRMGATLTGEQAAALAEADDAIKRMGQSWDGLARTLTAEVAPGLTAVFDATANAISQEPKILSLAKAWDAVKNAAQKDGLGTTWADVLREAQKEEPTQRFTTGTRLPPGGRNRAPFTPGYQPSAEKPPRSSSGASSAEREAAAALEAQAQAYENIYTAGMQAIEGLRTPVEEQIAQYHEAKYALENLAATYPNLADQAAAALARLEVDGLEDIQITAERIFPEAEQSQLSVFFEEASRNVQNVLADFLFDPFSKGIDGLIEDFGRMLAQMAAQAIAADIAGKIFGTGGVSGGGGWLGQVADFGMSLFGSFGGGAGTASINGLDMALVGLAEGGMVDGSSGGVLRGPGTGTSDSIPAITRGGRPLLLSSGEHITRAAVVSEPGAESFLAAFNRYGMDTLEGLMGFAGGGTIPGGHFGIVSGDRIRAANAGMNPRASSEPMSVTQQFTIQAPAGSISRATQQQVAAAAARGLAQANRRNN